MDVPDQPTTTRVLDPDECLVYPASALITADRTVRIDGSDVRLMHGRAAAIANRLLNEAAQRCYPEAVTFEPYPVDMNAPVCEWAFGIGLTYSGLFERLGLDAPAPGPDS